MGMRYVQKVSKDKHVVIQMDTTYWGRGFGLMVIKDSLRKKVLWRKYVTHETKADYLEGVAWLEKHGFKIYGIVVDGMWGLMQELRHYPVQMCQFHQIMIVRRYLAEDQDLEASKALLELVNSICLGYGLFTTIWTGLFQIRTMGLRESSPISNQRFVCTSKSARSTG